MFPPSLSHAQNSILTTAGTQVIVERATRHVPTEYLFLGIGIMSLLAFGYLKFIRKWFEKLSYLMQTLIINKAAIPHCIHCISTTWEWKSFVKNTIDNNNFAHTKRTLLLYTVNWNKTVYVATVFSYTGFHGLIGTFGHSFSWIFLRYWNTQGGQELGTCPDVL